MPGKSTDPKRTRITVRLSDTDLEALTAAARKRGVTVGAVVRDIIRGNLGPPARYRTSAKR
jgi:predicted DNA binding CopG/RHH family protein